MWIAEMESEHYSWRAAGTTKASALETLADGFLHHLTRSAPDPSTEVSADWIAYQFGEGEDDLGKSIEELKFRPLDYYGAHATRFKAGQCFVDGAEI